MHSNTTTTTLSTTIANSTLQTTTTTTKCAPPEIPKSPPKWPLRPGVMVHVRVDTKQNLCAARAQSPTVASPANGLPMMMRRPTPDAPAKDDTGKAVAACAVAAPPPLLNRAARLRSSINIVAAVAAAEAAAAVTGDAAATSDATALMKTKHNLTSGGSTQEHTPQKQPLEQHASDTSPLYASPKQRSPASRPTATVSPTTPTTSSIVPNTLPPPPLPPPLSSRRRSSSSSDARHIEGASGPAAELDTVAALPPPPPPRNFRDRTTNSVSGSTISSRSSGSHRSRTGSPAESVVVPANRLQQLLQHFGRARQRGQPDAAKETGGVAIIGDGCDDSAMDEKLAPSTMPPSLGDASENVVVAAAADANFDETQASGFFERLLSRWTTTRPQGLSSASTGLQQRGALRSMSFIRGSVRLFGSGKSTNSGTALFDRRHHLAGISTSDGGKYPQTHTHTQEHTFTPSPGRRLRGTRLSITDSHIHVNMFEMGVVALTNQQKRKSQNMSKQKIMLFATLLKPLASPTFITSPVMQDQEQCPPFRCHRPKATHA